MKKYCITGISSFVAPYLLTVLNQQAISINTTIDVLGLSRSEPTYDLKACSNIKVKTESIDLLNSEALSNSLKNYQPNVIVHLAASSSVGYGWGNPALVIKNNFISCLNLLEAVRVNELKAKILLVGSSEIYGDVTKSDMPLGEDRIPAPNNPYSIARVAQENIATLYSESYGLEIVQTRSFNHIGPGQKVNFVIPSFAKKVMDFKSQGHSECSITTGNLEIIRDFLDVRDVVNAYLLLLDKGINGQIYNICSGNGTKLKDLLNLMGEIAGITVNNEVDPKLVRPQDNKIIIGDNSKLKTATGWQINFDLKTTVKAILNQF